MVEKKIRVMFICYGNACRSLMAESICNLYGQGRVIAESAGTSFILPDIEVDQPTIIEMKRLGLDVSGHKPRRYTSVDMSRFDLIVNMSPVKESDLLRFSHSFRGFQGKIISWNVRDPRGKLQRVYAQVVDEIKERALKLIRELIVESELQKKSGLVNQQPRGGL